MFFQKKIDIIYVIFAVTFSWFTIIFNISFPQILRSFLALPLLVIIPLRTGYSTLLVAKRENVFDFFNLFIKYFLYWCIGSIIILSLSILLSIIGIFDINILTIIVLLIVLEPIIINTIQTYSHKFSFYSLKGANKHTTTRTDSKTKLFRALNNTIKTIKGNFLIFSVISGLIFAALFRAFSEFPFQAAYDAFAENVLFNKIYFDNFFSIFRSDYSSTFFFSGKTPIFSLIIAIILKLIPSPENISNLSYVSFAWVIPFLFGPIFSVGNYLLTLQITKNKIIAFAASLISLWICEFEQPTFIHPVQSSLSMVILPFLFLTYMQILKLFSQKSKKIEYISIVFVTIFIFHYFLGGYIILSLSIMTIYYYLAKKNKKLEILIYSASFTTIFFIFMLRYNLFNINDIINSINLDLLNISSLEQYSLDINDKFYLIDKGNTLTIFDFSLLGALYFLIKPIKNNRWIAYYFILNLGIYFMPINVIHRIFPIGHIFTAVFTSYIIFQPLIRRKINVKAITQNRVTLFLIFFSISAILLTPMTWYISKYDGNVSSFSKDELLMSEWIEENTARDFTIVSEPATQIVFEALSNRESIEGLYLTKDKARLIKTAIISDNDILSCALLHQLNNDKILIIVTERVYHWAINVRERIIYTPIILNESAIVEYSNILSKFNESSLFELKNNINNVYVFEPKLKQDVVINLINDDVTITNCDQPVSEKWWSYNYGIFNISHSTDNTEGEYSKRVIGENLTGWQTFAYNMTHSTPNKSLQTTNISNKAFVSIDVKLIDYTLYNPDDQSFQITLVDEQGKKKWWWNSKSFNVKNGTDEWQTIYLDLWNPDLDEGADLNNIQEINFRGNFENQNLDILIDNIIVTTKFPFYYYD